MPDPNEHHEDEIALAKWDALILLSESITLQMKAVRRLQEVGLSDCPCLQALELSLCAALLAVQAQMAAKGCPSLKPVVE